MQKNMKKVVFIVILGLIFVISSGCGKKNIKVNIEPAEYVNMNFKVDFYDNENSHFVVFWGSEKENILALYDSINIDNISKKLDIGIVEKTFWDDIYYIVKKSYKNQNIVSIDIPRRLTISKDNFYFFKVGKIVKKKNGKETVEKFKGPLTISQFP